MTQILNVEVPEACRRCGGSVPEGNRVELQQHGGTMIYFCLKCWFGTVAAEIEERQKYLLNKK